MIISDIVTESLSIYKVYSNIDRDKIIKYSIGLLRDEKSIRAVSSRVTNNLALFRNKESGRSSMHCPRLCFHVRVIQINGRIPSHKEKKETVSQDKSSATINCNHLQYTAAANSCRLFLSKYILGGHLFLHQ